MSNPDRAGRQGLWHRTKRTAQLIRVLGPREVRLRYRQSVLDVLWAGIGPVVIMITYGYILTRAFDATMACGPYATGAWTGLVVWTFFATAVGSGVGSLVGSADLIGKLYFPREALPLAGVSAAGVELAVSLVTVLVVAMVQGVDLGIMSLTILLPLAVLVVWTAAISVLAGVLAAFVRDTVQIVNLGLRVGFFATPVMYDSSFLPEPLERLSLLNPVAVAIDGARAALMCNGEMNYGLLGAQLAAGATALVLAVVYTRSVEARISDVV